MRGRLASTLVVSAFASAFAFAACDATTTTELRAHAVDGASGVAASCRASAEVLCKRVAECTPDYVPFFFQTEAACIDVVRARCEQRYEGPGAGDAPAICDAAARAPCASLANPETAVLSGPANVLLSFCDVAGGRLVVGERCLRDGDCRSGYCNIDERIVGDPCGVCVASAGAGEGCGYAGGDARCRAGLSCSAGRCRVIDEGVPLGKLGDPCVEQGCDLTHRFACAEPEKICGEVTVVGPGEACDPYGQARPGKRFCDFRSLCSDALVCEPRSGFGEPCTERSCHPTFECVAGACRHPPLRSSCKVE
jgi:hypothetical protein